MSFNKVSSAAGGPASDAAPQDVRGVAAGSASRCDTSHGHPNAGMKPFLEHCMEVCAETRHCPPPRRPITPSRAAAAAVPGQPLPATAPPAVELPAQPGVGTTPHDDVPQLVAAPALQPPTAPAAAVPLAGTPLLDVRQLLAEAERLKGAGQEAGGLEATPYRPMVRPCVIYIVTWSVTFLASIKPVHPASSSLLRCIDDNASFVRLN